MTKIRRAAVGALLACTLAGTASAHTMWIQPSRFSLPSGEILQVDLRLGEPGDSEQLARDPRLWRRFEAVGRDGAAPIPGLDAHRPAGLLRPDDDKPLHLVYLGRSQEQDIDGRLFQAYLVEEGYEDLAVEREIEGAARATVRERFTRSLKSVVVASGRTAAGDPADRLLDLPFEIVHQGRDAEGRQKFAVFYRGRPLGGARVRAVALDGVGSATFATTDAKGGIHLALPPGDWLLSSVRIEHDKGAEVAWSSWWTALSLRLGR